MLNDIYRISQIKCERDPKLREGLDASDKGKIYSNDAKRQNKKTIQVISIGACVSLLQQLLPSLDLLPTKIYSILEITRVAPNKLSLTNSSRQIVTF